MLKDETSSFLWFSWPYRSCSPLLCCLFSRLKSPSVLKFSAYVFDTCLWPFLLLFSESLLVSLSVMGEYHPGYVQCSGSLVQSWLPWSPWEFCLPLLETIFHVMTVNQDSWILFMATRMNSVAKHRLLQFSPSVCCLSKGEAVLSWAARQSCNTLMNVYWEIVK